MTTPRSSFDIVTELAQNHLSECECRFFSRTNEHQLRNNIDCYVTNHFLSNNWPKQKPIILLDVGSGKLLQIATIVTNLVLAGFIVHLSLVDARFKKQGYSFPAINETKAEDVPENLKVDAAIAKLRIIFSELNKKVGKENAAEVIGIFSNIDSYIATVKGIAPLKYEVVPAKEIGARVLAGAKRRYLLPDMQLPPEASYPALNKNNQFAWEFKEGERCHGKPPDLVLVIDDITEFYPLVTGIERYRSRYTAYKEEDLDYAYKQEIVIPIKQLNPQAEFLGTQKTYLIPHVEVRFIDREDRESIIFGTRSIKDPVLISSGQHLEKKKELSLSQPSQNTLSNETLESKKTSIEHHESNHFQNIKKIVMDEVMYLLDVKKLNLANKISTAFQDCIAPFLIDRGRKVSDEKAALSKVFCFLGDANSSLSISFKSLETKHGLVSDTLYTRLEKWAKKNLDGFDSFFSWKKKELPTRSHQ